MRCVLTGASGFVGGALAKKLLALGHEVIALSRRDIPELRALKVTVEGFDLDNPPQALPASVRNADCIFHVAAKVSMWGDFEEFYRTNVKGTQALLTLARESGIKRFIYTSSPSVVANGKNLRGVDESQPYPPHFAANYPKTKALAEKAVLAANCGEFRTVVLRPHLIFGPGDTNMIPTVISRAKQGRLVRIGKGRNLVDFCYIDDCVDAHLKALYALEHNAVAASGKAYFISQGQPVPLWEWINRVLRYNGMPEVRRSLPRSLASGVAMIAEVLCRYLLRRCEPPLTRFLVEEMATDHYFDISAARRDLGFSPSQSVWEALDVTFKRSA